MFNEKVFELGVVLPRTLASEHCLSTLILKWLRGEQWWWMRGIIAMFVVHMWKRRAMAIKTLAMVMITNVMWMHIPRHDTALLVRMKRRKVSSLCLILSWKVSLWRWMGMLVLVHMMSHVMMMMVPSVLFVVCPFHLSLVQVMFTIAITIAVHRHGRVRTSWIGNESFRSSWMAVPL